MTGSRVLHARVKETGYAVSMSHRASRLVALVYLARRLFASPAKENRKIP